MYILWYSLDTVFFKPYNNAYFNCIAGVSVNSDVAVFLLIVDLLTPAKFTYACVKRKHTMLTIKWDSWLFYDIHGMSNFRKGFTYF